LEVKTNDFSDRVPLGPDLSIMRRIQERQEKLAGRHDAKVIFWSSYLMNRGLNAKK